MKTQLLKISAVVLLLGLSQGANAAALSKTNTTTLIDTNVMSASFFDIVAKNTSFTDDFKFTLSQNAKVTGTVTASFSNAAKQFVSPDPANNVKPFDVALYDISNGGHSLIVDFGAKVATDNLSEAGSFNAVNLSKNHTYEIEVIGKTPLSYGDSYSGSISVSPVPEPEEWAMMMLGLPLMGLVAKRRKSSAAVITA